MPTVDLSHIDLECCGTGHSRSSAAVRDGYSISYEGSCYYRFYSIADGPHDDYSFTCGSDLENGRGETCGSDLENGRARKVSSAAEANCSENRVGEIKVHLEKVERDCRICHMTLESTNSETGIPIELGCSCKDDLAAAHKNCAETWFKIRGNRTCEICNSVARNVSVTNEIEVIQQRNDANFTAMYALSAANTTPAAESRRCLNGHRLVNFLLACMVCAFVISWLFHFKIPS